MAAMSGGAGRITVPYVDLKAQNAPHEEAMLEAFRRVLRHGGYILGPEVAELEAELSRRHDGAHVFGVANGTDALVLALRVLGIGPGDEVITVSHSFVATASAIVLAGATPVFADVDEHTLTLDVDDARGLITERTRAILSVHLAGRPADLDALASLCAEHELHLVEDCAQAIGATWRGRAVGTFGLGCWSLHPLKALAAVGDGGFVATTDPQIADRIKQHRNLGLLSRDHVGSIAGNSRLDTLHAAALLVKIQALDGMLARRRAHAAFYDEHLPAELRRPAGDDALARWAPTAYVVRHPRRDALRDGLVQRGVDAKIHYPVAIHQQPPFAPYVTRPLPVTERAVSRILSLPSSSELTDAQRDRVVQAAHEAVADLS
jgi:dTDP-4-amino-4,6-dideoxygalactose transaminase